MIKKKLVALGLAAVMGVSMIGCKGTAKSNNNILVIGVDATFEEKWNPFLVESAYDHQVIDQIFTPVMQVNAKNELESVGGSVKSEDQGDGTVLYTININKNMKFSDGKPITIDDYIYALYVFADPSHTGPTQLVVSDIEGVKDYYYDDPNYSAKLKEFEQTAEEKYTSGTISFEDFLTYAKATNLDGWWTGDPAGDIGSGMTWSEYAIACGYEEDLNAIDATNADQMFELIAKIDYETSVEFYDTYTWWLDNLKASYASGNLEDGIDVNEISGIKKIDNYTCTVKYTKVDIYAERSLALKNGVGRLIPKHHYGEFTKGDVSGILKNMTPLGSGPYVWGGFSDNIVTCTANPDYFRGVPKTGTVRWQYIPQEDIISSLASGAIDIANPNGTKDNVEQLKKQSIQYHMVDRAGYGYLAMNTERVPLFVRKGFWSLINRGPAIEGYYGSEIAHVIERPMTTVVAEYPVDAAPYYEYSRDKALEFFTQAGYEQKDGKLVDKDGKQLVLNIYIGGSGKGDHPAYAMLTQASEDMKALGGELQIQDVDFATLQGAMNDGTADMWVMAWSDVFDCDKTTQFHSTGGQNKYRFKDAKMDTLLENVIQTIDQTERSKLVSEMLDYAMDQCLEYPLYQRKDIIAYNANNLNMNTIPTATSFYNYESELYKVEATGGANQ